MQALYPLFTLTTFLNPPCHHQNIPQPRPPPLTIHNSPIPPINPLNLIQQPAHRMPPITRAFQRADDLVLRELRGELLHGKRDGVGDLAVDADEMVFA